MTKNFKATLFSAAILSNYWIEQKKDVIDFLAHFVMVLLSKNFSLNEAVKTEKISEMLSNEFMFSEIPQKVVEGVLSRISRYENPMLIKKDGLYFLCQQKEEIAAEFEKIKQITGESIKRVFDAYKNYCSNNYVFAKIDSPEEDFSSFFENYGFAVICKDFSNVLSQEEKKGKNNDFLVGKFILDQVNRSPSLIDEIVKFAEGHMIKKAVYFTGGNVQSQGKLAKTAFYLDTRVMLHLLGFKDSYGNKAAQEMCNNVLIYGGKLFCFSHTKAEIESLLRSHILYPNGYQENRLEYFDGNNANTAAYDLALSSLEDSIRKKGVVVIDKPIFKIDEKLKYDEEDFRKFLSKESAVEKLGRIDIDIASITSIIRIRDRDYSPGISDLSRCTAVFVTTNSFLVNNTKEYFDLKMKDGYRPEMFEGLAAHDIVISTILWLSFGNNVNSENLPKLLLISNAQAALQPTPYLIRKAKETVSQYKDLCPNATRLIEDKLCNIYYQNELMEKTAGDPVKYVDFVSKELEDAKKTFDDAKKNEEILKEKERENKRLIDENEEKLEQKEREQKRLLLENEEKLEQKENENRRLLAEKEGEHACRVDSEKKNEKITKKILDKPVKRNRHFSIFLVGFIDFLLVVTLCAILWAISGFPITKEDIASKIVVLLGGSIFAIVISFVDFLVSKMGFIRKINKTLFNLFFDQFNRASKKKIKKDYDLDV